MKIPEYSMCLIGLRLYYVCLRLWLGSHIIIFLCDIKSTANQMTGFYMKCKTGLNWVNVNLNTESIVPTLLLHIRTCHPQND